ncbi:hypothetical protein Sjap_018235 [Stephania japonica]|uniref:Uncharacterized protein n=1 Tax=Stephania japonica TaxID=461633 RepID=A0AAP0I7R0_9MAGN
MLGELDLSWQEPQSMALWMSYMGTLAHDNRRRCRSRSLALIWNLWLERNSRIFGGKVSSWEEVWNATMRGVANVIFGHKDFSGWWWNQLNEH